MGLCHRLSDVRSPRRRTACLAAQIQLASPTRQPKVQTTHQSPRSNPGQPVEAPQLASDCPRYRGRDRDESTTILSVSGTTVLRGKTEPGHFPVAPALYFDIRAPSFSVSRRALSCVDDR